MAKILGIVLKLKCSISSFEKPKVFFWKTNVSVFLTYVTKVAMLLQILLAKSFGPNFIV